MMKSIAMYLAGSIKKGHEKSDDFYWTEEDMALLSKNLDPHPVSFLNPAFRTDDLSDTFSVFGRDMLQVFSSNLIFVDARDRRGLGVGAEMMWAKVNKIPVVTWAPRNSHYRKDQTTLLGVPVTHFVHPFVASLSDVIVSDLVEGAQWIRGLLANPFIKIKGIEEITLAMQHYKDLQLPNDRPMHDLLKSCEELHKRAYRAHPQVVLSSN